MPDTEVPEPRMFSWLNPKGLVTLGASVVLATEFGHYADRREMEAALSPTAAPRGQSPYADHEVWVDFVSDVGDAFDPTYTVARLLAQEELALQEPGDAHGALPAAGAEPGGTEDLVEGVAGPAYRTARGAVLLMGGDQAYPWGTLDRYRRHTLLPYGRALPPPVPGAPPGAPPPPHVYAIPGNHDWYDGLDSFLRLFTRGEFEDAKFMGGWQVQQRRSYFARRITRSWWVWGLDTQLSDDLDRPQREYFEARSAELAPGDNVVVCTATPCWAENDKPSFDPAVNRWLDAFEAETITVRGARLRLLLSGDSHHYAHHVRTRDELHAFTAGGGGAYTSDTHHLVDRDAAPDRPGFVPPSPVHPDGDTGFRPRRAWPSPATSRAMGKAILKPLQLASNNAGFAVLVGVLYLVYALAVGRWYQGGLGAIGLAQVASAQVGPVALGSVFRGLLHAPSAWLLTGALFAGLCGFSRAETAGSKVALGGMHAAGHVVTAVLVSWLALSVGHLLAPAPEPLNALVIVVLVLGVGGLAGSWVMSLYLWLADRFAHCNSTELLAAQRYTTYKNFLRLHVVGDDLTVYPVGIPASGRYVDRNGTSLPDPGLAPFRLVERPVACPYVGSGRPDGHPGVGAPVVRHGGEPATEPVPPARGDPAPRRSR